MRKRRHRTGRKCRLIVSACDISGIMHLGNVDKKVNNISNQEYI